MGRFPLPISFNCSFVDGCSDICLTPVPFLPSSLTAHTEYCVVLRFVDCARRCSHRIVIFSSYCFEIFFAATSTFPQLTINYFFWRSSSFQAHLRSLLVPSRLVLHKRTRCDTEPDRRWLQPRGGFITCWFQSRVHPPTSHLSFS